MAGGCRYRRVPESPTRHITRACSGRTRASRPVLEERTGRATRRAADAQRWADEIKSERKTLKQGSRPRGLLSSPTRSSSAPRRWPSGPLRRGASPVLVARAASAPQTVGMQHSRPSSCGTVRSAGADIRLGGLGSRRLQLALGDMRGGMRLLLRRGVLSDVDSRC